MPLIITDRDLLIVEPTVFLDAATVATELFAATDGAIAGATLTSASAAFETAGISAGHVLRLNRGQAIEIVERTAEDELEVSLPRVAADDVKIAPGDGTALAFSVPTFARLIAQVQAAAMAALGLDPDHPTRPLDASAIIDPAPVQQWIALKAIALAFGQAAALDPADVSIEARAKMYEKRAAAASHAVAALIDLDGDGVPDCTRRMDTITMSRA